MEGTGNKFTTLLWGYSLKFLEEHNRVHAVPGIEHEPFNMQRMHFSPLSYLLRPEIYFLNIHFPNTLSVFVYFESKLIMSMLLDFQHILFVWGSYLEVD